MKKKKIAIVAIVILLALGISVFVTALPGMVEETVPTPTYTRPPIGDLVGESDPYPDVMTADGSQLSAEKAWYEYITYVDEPAATTLYSNVEERPVFEQIFRDLLSLLGITFTDDLRIAFYDPLDYTNALIMKFGETESNDYTDAFEDMMFATANSITVSYASSKTEVHDREHNVNLDLTLSAKFLSIVNAKFQATYGYHRLDSEKTFHESNVSQVFNAVYFNENNVPYAWRIVSYRVLLPLRCELQREVNGEWVTEEGSERFILLPTIQGVCRQWVENGDVYYEHWATGEKVAQAGFWSGFFSEEELIKAYKNSLIPTK